MSLTQSYGVLLKRYMPEKLLQNEFAKRNYLWSKVKKDSNWHGGVYEVPLEAAGFSSVQMGGLPDTTDIGELAEGMGLISSQKTLVGTIKVREEDLTRHVDMEASYLKIMPDKIQDMLDFMQAVWTLQVLNNGYISKLTANGDSTGVAKVDRASIVLFRVGMKVEIVDDDTAAATGYVTGVDLNSKSVAIKTARGGSTAVDLTTFTTAQNARIRVVGAGAENFLSLKGAALSATNGGSDTLYGVNKSDYTVLQSYSEDWTSNTDPTKVLPYLFNFAYGVQEIGRGNQNELLVSWGVFKNAVASLEGTRRYTAGQQTGGYGYKSIDLMGPDGNVTLTAVRGMPTDTIYAVDWSAIKFAGYDFFSRKRYNGDEFFVVRENTGVSFISDIMLRGDVVINPSKISAAYKVPAALSV